MYPRPSPPVYAENFLKDPLSRRIWPRLAFTCLRVFDETLPIPDDATDIHFVVQDAVASLGIAVDCAETPIATARRRDAILVQLGSNPFRRFPNDVVVKDSANHLGLRRIDDAIAADRLAICLELLDDVIAIRVTTARLAKLDPATQPAARLVGEVLEKEGIHRALEANMQMRDLAL
jgi:hypothetical protein